MEQAEQIAVRAAEDQGLRPAATLVARAELPTSR
jgi:hypothetical protein